MPITRRGEGGISSPCLPENNGQSDYPRTPQDTPGHPRTLQDSTICMFKILYERVDDGLVLVCWCINQIILTDQFGWMDGKRTDTIKHDHATYY